MPTWHLELLSLISDNRFYDGSIKGLVDSFLNYYELFQIPQELYKLVIYQMEKLELLIVIPNKALTFLRG